jgi:hypothetical protein
MNLRFLCDDLWNGQRSYFSTFWNLPFSTLLSFSPHVVQNHNSDFRQMLRDVIQETGKVPQMQTTRQERHASSIRQLNRTDTWYSKHWSLKLVAVRVLLKTNRQEQNSSVQNTTWGCVLYHTKLHFQGPTNTKLEKQSTHTHTHTHISKYIQLLLNWYFLVVFCDEMTGMKGVWILQKALWKNRKLLGGPMYVYLFSLATLKK